LTRLTLCSSYMHCFLCFVAFDRKHHNACRQFCCWCSESAPVAANLLVEEICANLPTSSSEEDVMFTEIMQNLLKRELAHKESTERRWKEKLGHRRNLTLALSRRLIASNAHSCKDGDSFAALSGYLIITNRQCGYRLCCDEAELPPNNPSVCWFGTLTASDRATVLINLDDRPGKINLLLDVCDWLLLTE